MDNNNDEIMDLSMEEINELYSDIIDINELDKMAGACGKSHGMQSDCMPWL